MSDLDEALHARADRLGPMHLDLQAVITEGERRLRRRRHVWIAGGVGTAVVLAAGMAVGSTIGEDSSHRRDRAMVAVTPADPPDGPTYAVGSVLHRGSETLDVGVTVRTLVATPRGAVLSDAGGRVLAVHDGSVSELGRTADVSDSTQVLRASGDGSHVAWLTPAGDGYTLVRYDDAGATTAEQPLGDSGRFAEIEAVTSTAVWVSEDRGLVRYDGAGAEVVVRGATRGHLADAGESVLLRDGASETAGRLLAAPDLSDAGVVLDGPGDATLSPDGAHALSDDYDEAWVFDTTTGERRDLELPGAWFVAPYAWVDDDTIAAVAVLEEESKVASIATCEVETVQCVVTAGDIGSYDPLTFTLDGGLDLTQE